jgi:1-acyl-sn-glycerol-3-phosphate acyltransferase
VKGTGVSAGTIARHVLYPVVSVVMRVLFRLDVKGSTFIPRSGPAVLVANHQGYLDPVFLQMGTTRTIRYMMTSAFYDIRPARPVFKLFEAIRVPEEGSQRDSVKAALTVLREGGLLGIFPEGRLTLDGSVGPVLPGAAYLAAKGNAPVVPACIDGSFNVMGKSQRRFRQARVRVRYGPPITIRCARGEEGSRQIITALGALGINPAGICKPSAP